MALTPSTLLPIAPRPSTDRDSNFVKDALVGGAPDRRGLQILAKTIYRELRQSGLAEEDVMCVAGELLSHVAGEVKDRRRA